MGLLGDLLSSIAVQSAMDYGHRYLSEGTDPIVPDAEYVRIWLRSARITDVRRWTQKFYPAVHARFVYADPMLGMREVVSVSSPYKTFHELDSRHLDRFIVINQPLLGPIPYRGELTSEVALFSVAAENLAKPYLDLLSNLTATASVSYLSAIEPFIAPIKRGAEILLLDPGRAELEIGLSRTDVALMAGSIIVARTDKNGPGLRNVTLDPEDWRLLDSHGRRVTDFPYMVLGVERLSERSDFRSIPDIRAGWKKVWDAATKGESSERVLAEFHALHRVIRLSPDLVSHDRERVSTVFAGELHQAGFTGPDLPGPPTPIARPPALLESLTVSGAWRPEGRLSLADARGMVLDPTVPEYVIRSLFTANPSRSKAFSPAIMFDPNVVVVEPPENVLEALQVMNWTNELASFRRRNQFLARQMVHDPRPVLVSVGDSWFQFPVFLDDLIDQLGDAYSIWSLDVAGDTLANMILKERRHLAGLRRWSGKACALLLSGSGNDIVGEDPDGISVLTKILRPFEAGKPAAWYVDTAEFRRRLLALETCFREVFECVAAEFPNVPVICHGYDHAIPAGPDDPRRPLWAKADQWLAGPMSGGLGIYDPQLQSEIVKTLIDKLNEMLSSLCGGNAHGTFPNAWYVNARGAVRWHWADELHPTDAGFSDVARCFRGVLDAALVRPAAMVETRPSAVLEDIAGERAEKLRGFVYSEAQEDQAENIEVGSVLDRTGPIRRVSVRAYDLIVQHETGGRRYYETIYKGRPVWPGEASGITIGFGYDLGYCSADAFDRDWAALSAEARARLRLAIGKHGRNTSMDELRTLLPTLNDLAVDWDLAEQVFRSATLSNFVRLTQRALPNTAELSPDSFGALVSLTLNLGAGGYTAASDPHDRYREMRGVRAAMQEHCFADVPQLLRLMKRVWRATSIEQEMSRRREDEARLFEAGLAKGKAHTVAARFSERGTFEGPIERRKL